VLSWFAQSFAGWAAYNEIRLQQLQDPLSWGSYLLNADFWACTLQNWQSEFLAVGSMAVLSSYLRQRGSSQSKPVGARTRRPASRADVARCLSDPLASVVAVLGIAER